MTNEEAIKIIGSLKPGDRLDTAPKANALILAMEALKGTNKPSEDKEREIILRNLETAINELNRLKNDIRWIQEVYKDGTKGN